MAPGSVPPPPSGKSVGSFTSSQTPSTPTAARPPTRPPHQVRVAPRVKSGNAARPGHTTPVQSAPVASWRKCPPAMPSRYTLHASSTFNPGSAMTTVCTFIAASVRVIAAGSAKCAGSQVKVRKPSMCWMSSQTASTGIARVRNCVATSSTRAASA